MVAGLENIKGLEFLESVDLSSIFKGIGSFILLLAVAGIVAIVVGGYLYFRKQKDLYDQHLHFFEEVLNKMVPIEDLKGAELIIPGTSIKVFYIKSKDMYMPRGTKKMGKKAYWYAIRNNREIVNFVMKNLNQDMIEAGLDYDHTDMRLAYENLRAIIKRNYKDKATKWWREYKDIISVVVLVFVLSVSFFFLIRQISGLIENLGPLTENINNAVNRLADCGASSGVK